MPEEILVERGDTLLLECAARGDKPLDLVWVIGDTRFENLVDSRILQDEVEHLRHVTSKLILEHTKRTDSARYTCIATNSFGHDSSATNVKILEKPEVVSNVAVNSYSSRTVQLSWSEPYNGNSPVTKYIIQYKNYKETWKKAAKQYVSANTTYETIDNFHPAYTYQFRVMAENELGQSQPSESVVVTTEEEIPTGVPLDVTGRSIDSESLLIEWKPPSEDQSNGQLLGYYIGFRPASDGGPYMYISVPVEPEAYKMTNLQKYTTYSVVVSAYNRRGTGPSSKELVIRTAEDVPTSPPLNVQALPLTSESISTEWRQPVAEDIHGVLLGYKVICSPVPSIYDEGDATPIVKQTSGLTATIYNLQKYTNYSIKVLAFTKVGDGVKSEPVFARTLEDIPSPPSRVKAVSPSRGVIIISWLPPLHPNGIITGYSVFARNNRQGEKNLHQVEVKPHVYRHKLEGLHQGVRYTFWVTALTSVGPSIGSEKVTKYVSATGETKVITFGERFKVLWQTDVHLDCETAENSNINVSWTHNGRAINFSAENIMLLGNHTLSLKSVDVEEAGKYKCMVKNTRGSDEIVHTVIVKAPPPAATIRVLAVNSTSISLGWETRKIRGSSFNIRGATVHYKKEFSEWNTEDFSINKSNNLLITNLFCGNAYHVYMTLHNRIGSSKPSNQLTVSTKGRVPQAPKTASFIQANATSAVLQMSLWSDKDCPIKSYDINYRKKNTEIWIPVANNVQSHLEKYSIKDLLPARHYQLKMSVHNDAGSSVAVYDFSTSPITDSKGKVIMVTEESERSSSIYLAPVLGGLLALGVLIIAAFCFIRQKRRQSLRYAYQTEKTAKHDPAAGSALISDTGDKKQPSSPFFITAERLNRVTQDSEGSCRRWHPVQVPGSSKSLVNVRPDVTTELENDVNPYATCQIYTEPVAPNQLDLLGDNFSPGRLKKQQIPTYNNLSSQQPTLLNNKPVCITPVQASLMWQQDAMARSLAGTTLSSNYDELRRAYEQFKLTNQTTTIPEADPQGQASGCTDSGESFDPGIVCFTQCPPAANEQREGTCIMSVHQGSQTHLPPPPNRNARRSASSETTTTDQELRPTKERPKRPKRSKSQASVGQQRRPSQGNRSPKITRRKHVHGSSSDEELTASPSDLTRSPVFQPHESDTLSPNSDITATETRVPLCSTTGRKAENQSIECMDLFQRPVSKTEGDSHSDQSKIMIRTVGDTSDRSGYGQHYTFV